MQKAMKSVSFLILFLSIALGFSHTALALNTAFTVKYRGDFNGDGVMDTLYQGGNKFIFVDVDNVQAPIKVGEPSFGVTIVDGATEGETIHPISHLGIVDWRTQKYHLLVGDFDGDTCDDIFLQAKSSNLNSYILFSQCSGDFNSISQTFSNGDLGADWSIDKAQLQVGDVNGDLRADLVVRTNIAIMTFYADVNGKFSGEPDVIDYIDSRKPHEHRTGTIVAGKSNGAFDVDARGAASYSLPVTLPPGMAGMQPSLSIDYSSQGGNGNLGTGWSLNGISVIHRCPQTVAHDGQYRGVNLDNGDRLCLDGQRLVVTSGTYGTVGAQYRTEIDNFSRITQLDGDLTSGSSSFKVETKSGQTMFYGVTNDSRIHLSGKTPVYVWPVKSINDAVGNTITIKYTKEESKSHYQVESINYPSIDGEVASVRFLYEKRPDKQIGYRLGSQVVNDQRLMAIDTYVGEEFVRSVELYYDSGPVTSRSRIIKIQECAYNWTCLPATNFEWQDGEKGFADSGQLIGGLYGDYGNTAKYNRLMDVNGDGLQDIVIGPGFTGYVDPAGIDNWFWLRNTGNGYIDGGTLASGAYGASPPDEHIRSMDVDGDGKQDIVVGPNSNGDWFVLRNTGTSFVDEGAWITGVYGDYVNAADHIWPMDVDGDGREDIVLYDTTTLGRWFVLRSTGKKFVDEGNWVKGLYPPGGWDVQHVKLLDIDGDGLAEMLYGPSSDGSWTAMKNTGTSFVRSYSILNTPYGAWNTMPERIRLLDVNGDGLQDIVLGPDSYDGNWFVLKNTGAGFVDAGKWISGAYGESIGTATKFMPMDVNGDGKQDIVIGPLYTGPITNLSFGWYVLRSTGTSFVDEGAWSQAYNDWINQTNLVQPADVNGDGQMDIMLGPDSGGNWYSLQNKGTKADLLLSVTDGLNNKTTIQYKPITDKSIYSQGICDNTYPTLCVHMPIYLVSEYTATNGVGSVNSYQYNYGDMRMDLRSKGVLGFGWIEKEDNTRNTRIRTVLSNDAIYKGMPKSITTYASNGVRISETINTLDRKYTKGAAYFPYFSVSTESKFDLDGMKITETVMTNEYSDDDVKHGNVSKVSVVKSSPVTGEVYTTVTENVYADTENASTWHLGRLQSSKVTHSSNVKDGDGNDIQSITRVSSFTYRSDGLLETSVEEPDDPGLNPGADPNLSLTTTYGYDAYGNKNSVTVEGGVADTLSYVAPRTSTTTIHTTGDLHPEVVSTNALGQSETKILNARHGDVETLIGPNGLITRWKYDGFGRKTRETLSDGTVTNISRNLCGLCEPVEGVTPSYFITSQTSGNYPTTIYYDKLGRELRVVARNYSGTVYKDTAYNNKGQVIKVSEPYFNTGAAEYWTENLSYDDLDRITAQRTPTGTTVTMTYLPLTTVSTVSALDENGVAFVTVNKKSYYISGDIKEVIDANGATTKYFYDAIGNLIQTHSPGETISSLPVKTKLFYDKKGRKTSMVDPDMGTWLYEYDALGNLRRQTDAELHVATIDYDLLGRKIQRVEMEGTTTWTYDTAVNGIGKMASVIGPDGFSRSYSYDNYGRLASVDTSIDSVNYNVSTVYDSYGRVEKIYYPVRNNENQRLVCRYKYDDSSSTLLSAEYVNYSQDIEGNWSEAGPATTFWELGNGTADPANVMTARGQLREFKYGNGLVNTTTYHNDSGMISSIIAGDGITQNMNFVFDSLGNLRTRQDLIGDGNPVSETFSYDSLNRLEQVKLNGTVIQQLDYSANGNILSNSRLGTYTYASDNHRLQTVTNSNGVVTAGYVYDSNGNITSDGARNINYTSYNKANYISRLDENGVLQTYGFKYGPEHARYKQMRQGGKVIYYLDAGVHYERELDSNGNVVEESHYLYAGGNMVGVYKVKTNPAVQPAEKSIETRYFHKDHIGSIVAITNESGNVVERLSYSAFGERRPVGGLFSETQLVSLETHHGFTGHEHLDDVGLIHMNARIYDPELGRFMSADPTVQFPDSTQGYNRYAYVYNNPLSHTDPSGYGILEDAADFWLNEGGQITLYAMASASGQYWLIGLYTYAQTKDLYAAYYATWTAYMYANVGKWTQNSHAAVKIFAHGMMGGISNQMQGRSFRNGFISGAVGKAITVKLMPKELGTPQHELGGFIVATIAGGISAELGGGKFKNGARTAAMGYLFNRLGNYYREHSRLPQFSKKEIVISEKQALAVYKFYKIGISGEITIDHIRIAQALLVEGIIATRNINMVKKVFVWAMTGEVSVKSIIGVVGKVNSVYVTENVRLRNLVNTINTGSISLGVRDSINLEHSTWINIESSSD